MPTDMRNPFKKPSADAIAREAAADALRCHLDHSMAAEHHQALADMYKARAKRLLHPQDDAPAGNVKPITKGLAA